jgi:hypothetical protein
MELLRKPIQSGGFPLANVKYERGETHRARRVFRRITIGPEEGLRTATEHIALLNVADLSPDLTGISPLIIVLPLSK